jgi:hypothetical protein
VARLLAEPAARPRRRGPDPRRVAVAAVGVAGVIALGAALLEWAQAPSAAPTDAKEAPIVRQDPVRALAIEHGLLSDVEPAEALQLEAAAPATSEGEGGADAAPVPLGASPPTSR